MIAFEGYEIIQKLKTDRYGSTYSARDLARARPVIIRQRAVQDLSTADIKQIAERCERLKKLKDAGLIKILDFFSRRNGNGSDLIFICESTTAKPYQERPKGTKFDVPAFLDIAVDLAATANRLHQMGILLKEMNPCTLMLSPADDTIILNTPLIMIASINPVARYARNLYDADVLSEVLPYISPEQTGRMNRQVDYRSDFYALGALFYEMLTGRPPFSAADPLELIHAHLARQPVPPAKVRTDIPDMLSRITLKLLSKMPEDRYQSAFGLMADLERCREQHAQAESIGFFALGNRDAPERLQLSEKLFGREDPLAKLLSIYEKVKSGSFEVLNLAGPAGIGKSRLVAELAWPVNESGGYFGSGRYEPFRQNIPFSAIHDAFRGVVKKILKESGDRLAIWKSEFARAIGPHAQMIIDFIPELALIMGDTREQKIESRAEITDEFFSRLCVDFLRVFARKEHPLVIFLDDLQWVDSASLHLIRYVLSGPAIPHCFLIGAYRENELSSGHPFANALNEVRAMGIPLGTLQLGPIGPEHIRQFILDTLSKNVAEVNLLAKLVYEKTRGNPLFVGQFMQSLYFRKLLYFDFSTGVWRWQEHGIKTLMFTDNVIELMNCELQKLPQGALELLKTAACIGSRFDIEILANASGTSPRKAAKGLLSALKAGYIVARNENDGAGPDRLSLGNPVPPAWNWPGQADADSPGCFEFLHDRVHQAVYDLVPMQTRKKLHFKIGKLLLARLSAEQLPDHIFNIVQQLNFGIALVDDPEERIGFARLYLIAGQRAKKGTAYSQAFTYFNTGISLLPPNCWEIQYELAFALYKEKMECDFINRNLAEAERLFQFIYARTKSTLDKATLLHFKMLMYAGLGRHEEAVATGAKGLSLLNVTLPQARGRHSLLLPVLWLRLRFPGRKLPLLAGLPEAKDARVRLALKMLLDLSFPAYLRNPYMIIAVAAKIIEISLKHGYSPATCIGFTIYGAALCAKFNSCELGQQWAELALQVNEKNGRMLCGTKILFYYANGISHWRHHIRMAISCHRQGIMQALENGDINYAVYHVQSLLIHMLAGGAALEDVDAELNRYHDLVTDSRDSGACNYLISLKQTLKCLRGETLEKPCSLDDDHFREADHLRKMEADGIQIILLRHHMLKMQLLYIMEDSDGAIKSAQECRRMVDYHSGTIIETEFYFYESMIFLSASRLLPLKAKFQAYRLVQRHIRKFETLARDCPDNYEHKLLLLKGEKARQQGKFEKALKFFQQAVHSAKKNGFMQMEALANELAAKLSLDNGMPPLARTFLVEAGTCYLNWGAAAKCKRLKAACPQLLTGVLFSKDMLIACPMDYMTVVDALQAISTEIVLDRLLEKLMKVVTETAGAQKTFFILPNDGKLEIKAGCSEGGPIRITHQAMPVHEGEDLILAVLHFVQHTLKSTVIDDAQTHEDYRSDPYVIRHKPKSVFCLPVLRQSELIALLYFENNLTTDAFTPDRIQILQLIASQAAISIENARLYENVMRKERDLLELSSKLRSLSSELLLTEERERRRIAVELHDRIGHALANIKMQLGLLGHAHEQNKKTSILQGITELIDQSIQDTQSLSFDLSPPVLYDLGLEAAIEWLVDKTQEQYNLTITLTDDDQPKPLDESIRVLAFQATRELLFNVVKHAKAHRAWVSLKRRGDHMHIMITDDGIGINFGSQAQPHTKTHSGFGLFSIQERLKHFGGRLEIISEPGKGTSITLIAPMHEKEKHHDHSHFNCRRS